MLTAYYTNSLERQKISLEKRRVDVYNIYMYYQVFTISKIDLYSSLYEIK